TRGQPPAKVSLSAWEALVKHRFPGNVRELSHAMQHAVVLAGGGEITPEHLPATITSLSDPSPAPESPGQQGAALRPLAEAMRDLERDYLIDVMRQCRSIKS